MRKIAVLIDVDGTLIDSNDAHIDAWRRAFADKGYRLGWHELHTQIGKGADHLVPSLLPEAPKKVQEDIAKAHGEIFRREFLGVVEPFPNAASFLRKLVEEGHTALLASSSSQAEVDHYVDLLKADGLLCGTTTKDDVAHSKPDPDIFAAALRRSGYPADRAIIVGDTPYDLIAARRAGINSIAVLSGGFSDAELRACDPVAVYENVAELLDAYDRSPLA